MGVNYINRPQKIILSLRCGQPKKQNVVYCEVLENRALNFSVPARVAHIC